MAHSIVYIGCELHVRKVVTGISELVDTTLCIERSVWRQHVGAHSVNLKSAREGSSSQSWHEVGDVQTVSRESGVVGHATHVDRCFSAYMSAAFAHFEVGSITLSVGMHIGIKLYAVWYVERSCQRAWQHSLDEVEIVCTSFCLYVGTQTVGGCNVTCLAARLECEGCGIGQRKFIDAEPAHIAVDVGIDGYGSCRHSAQQLLGQESKQRNEIGLDYIALDVDVHNARIAFGKCRKVHLNLCRKH